MTPEEKIARLEQALDEPEGKYTHDQIAQKLEALYTQTGKPNRMKSTEQLRSKLGADDPGGAIDLNAGPQQPTPERGPRAARLLGLGPMSKQKAEEPVDDSFSTRITRGSERIGAPWLGKAINWVNEVPAMGIHRAMDAGTLGLLSGASDQLSEATGTQIGPSPADRQKFQDEHPRTAVAADIAGSVNPAGAPARIAKATSKAIDPLTRVIAKRMTTAPGRVAAKTLESGAVGGVTGATSAAGKKIVEGGDSAEALEAGLEGSKGGAALGTAFGAASGTAREGARAIRGRSPDIKALDEAGLEPGPLPGMPVIRKDKSILGQAPGTEPPLVGKATPGTRASAGRVAADEIVPDVKARSQASNRRFGELQRDAYAREGSNPAPVNHILADIDNRLGDLSLPGATKTALGTIREQIVQNSIPQGGKSILTAKQIDQLRDLTDTMVKRGDTKGDVQLIQVAENLRNTLAAPNVGPSIAALNAQQSDVMKGFGRVKTLLGTGRSQREPGEGPREAAARRITERGEDTKAAGARTGAEGHSVDRLIAQGPPEMLPGSQGPPQFDYKALLDTPRLQLAQERLQLNPSSLFSGVGGGVVGPAAAMGRALTRAPARLAYPTLRRAGDADIGRVGAGDMLVGAVKRRRDKKKKRDPEEAESMKEGV